MSLHAHVFCGAIAIKLKQVQRAKRGRGSLPFVALPSPPTEPPLSRRLDSIHVRITLKYNKNSAVYCKHLQQR